jgi:hypothetical protein
MLDRKSLEQIRLFNQEAPSLHARAMLKAAGEAPEESGLHLLDLLQWAIDNLGLDRSQVLRLQEAWDQFNLMVSQGKVSQAYRLLTGDDGTGYLATGRFEQTSSPKAAATKLVNLVLDLTPR